jgi:hypothetical protein
MIEYVWYAPIYDFIFVSKQAFHQIDVGPIVHKELIHSGLEFGRAGFVVKSDFGLTQYNCILLGEL